jgi:hypothetical protein
MEMEPLRLFLLYIFSNSNSNVFLNSLKFTLKTIALYDTSTGS